jgi:16S rRNA (guanine527-N7)-methyltransferase
VKDNGSAQADYLIRKGLAKLDITLTDQSISQLVQYLLELIKWNKKVNLVAKDTSLEELVEKHFLDSLTLIPVLALHASQNSSLLDVGSGAGFPGLVIKTACSERPVILLEPRQKRVSFLNHMIRLLALSGVVVLPYRTDEKAALSTIDVKIIISRAVTDVSSFLKMVNHLAIPDTLIICMQGDSGKEQWDGEKDNPKFERVGIEYIQLPLSHDHRTILVFRKKS